ncbi:hypothetical protein DTO027I6_8537 [Penicillium roqueforti]|uniref:uncharacterized protein n=1 Tax=Penicillium roqueforti TaxID=5082 RepID=UPI00190ACD13|nr:uncharacterized protein LCP9604111_5156 [Penicillium roqueforti]KAF9248406.1 hypothetical protein LCP9604111_5156 [Penicillium roqueforti]KAI3153451.1 hypothetical protein CBS147317_6259 [Penicillium roqueforti]KAI3190018.1 hypothetical protein DTO027I6_8537 [Penicillium roqueforti]
MGIFKIWEMSVSKIANVDSIFVEFFVQPHPVTNDTNMFGLTPERTDDVMIDMTAGYANKADDVLVERSWGEDNIAKLRAATKEYDPNGVFQEQVPGGYKLPAQVF